MKVPLLLLLASLLRLTRGLRYRAAVAVVAGENSSRRTLEHFERLSHTAASDGAQLIVFPEAALWHDASREEALANANAVGRIGSIPCDLDGPEVDDLPQVVQLSCIARAAKLVVVANVLSKVPCQARQWPRCPKDGYFIYNSDVVHDEQGRLVATYFKRHKYQPLDQPPLVPVSFNTSFGVEFGLLICYDMAFTSPAEQLAARGVRNFVFSTHWLNEVPLQTATASQQGFSRWFGANLLASNIADKPSHAGSGIFAAGEPVAVSFNLTGPWPMADAVLIADLNSVPPYPPAVSPLGARALLVAGEQRGGGSAEEAMVNPGEAGTGSSTPCMIETADDARSGTCTMLTPWQATGPQTVMRLVSSNVDPASGASVRCEATVQLRTAAPAAYALYSSAWRAASRLDVCALLPCQLNVNGSCPATYVGTLPATAITITMTTGGGARVALLSPLVSVGEAQLLPRAATQLSSGRNGTLATLTATMPAAGDEQAQQPPLYFAGLYAVDAASPEEGASRLLGPVQIVI